MTPPKSRTDQSSFKDAEALGHIRTMPEHKELPKVDEPAQSTAINDPDTFRMEIARAQMEGIPHLFVTKKVMDYLLRGNKGVSITYGNPGVRVYLEGTKEGCDDIEKLSAEAFHDHYIAMMRGERVEKARSK